MIEDRKAMEYLSAVSQLLMSIIGSGVLGFFLEKWLKARGLLLIVSILLGVIAGFIMLQRKIALIDKKK